MTKEEAIESLKKLKSFHNGSYGTAIDMAIKALEQQPCEDCISRTELLSRIDEERKYLLDLKMDGAEHVIVHHARQIIEDMPSVTPKGVTITDFADRCRECGRQTSWIPVSERLPEDGTWNLFTDGKNISIERYKLDIIDHFFPQGRWFDFENAIAWQPLPEPYAESEENK